MTTKSKILVIDDESEFCEFVKWSLEKTGRFEVVVSTDGPSGIARAETEKPELILLDIRMPQMNGAEVADTCFIARIRGISPSRSLQVFSTKTRCRKEAGIYMASLSSQSPSQEMS